MVCRDVSRAPGGDIALCSRLPLAACTVAARVGSGTIEFKLRRDFRLTDEAAGVPEVVRRVPEVVRMPPEGPRTLPFVRPLAEAALRPLGRP